MTEFKRPMVDAKLLQRTSAIFMLVGLQYGPASAQCDGSALQIEYGRLVGDGCTSSTETADESCTLTCDAGYFVKGTDPPQQIVETSDAEVSCNADVWSLQLLDSCAATEVANSDKSDEGSITGVIGLVVTVTCNEGYRDAGERLTTICQTDGTFSPVRCTAEECVPYGGLPHSDKAGAASIVGRTEVEVVVICDPGYSALLVIPDPEPFRFRFQINP
jgi:hypothetical protein